MACFGSLVVSYVVFILPDHNLSTPNCRKATDRNSDSSSLDKGTHQSSSGGYASSKQYRLLQITVDRYSAGTWGGIGNFRSILVYWHGRAPAWFHRSWGYGHRCVRYTPPAWQSCLEVGYGGHCTLPSKYSKSPPAMWEVYNVDSRLQQMPQHITILFPKP